MPQLRTGRRFGLSVYPYLQVLQSGSSEQQYYAVVALRINASSPIALRDHVVIAYFSEDQGTPPNAPTYNSGLSVADVLDGRADWSRDEVDEFRAFIMDDSRLGPWLDQRYSEIESAIQNCSLWNSQLMENDLSSEVVDEPLVKRAVIQRSATEASAMSQIRSISKRA